MKRNSNPAPPSSHERAGRAPPSGRVRLSAPSPRSPPAPSGLSAPILHAKSGERATRSKSPLASASLRAFRSCPHAKTGESRSPHSLTKRH
ncbi:MAG: hypothetical protein LBU37_14125 [Tannerellaceae bacterium]|nr:hypothetical protein [Tannerellaceae bacterium]